MDVSWKVTINGQVVEECWDDPVENVTSLDLMDLQERFGTYSDIEIRVWRANWQA